MAQILRYWACRVNPSGELTHDGNYANFGATTYNWLLMGNTSADNNNALLIYHAGISCKTNYGEGGSTSLPGKARDAFVNHWGMKPSADVRWRIWHLQTWEGDLKNQLDQGRPLLYSGGQLTGGGHSWVIDGYNSDNQFSCNWGFYGDYNGFYSLGNFDPPGDNGPYNQYESAIFWIEPNLSSSVGTPVLSSQTFIYSAAGYTITIPEVQGATSYEWNTEYGTIVGNSNSVKLYTDRTTQVSVRAYNSLCYIYSPIVSIPININYGPISGPSTVCDQATYTIDNFPSGATVVWSTNYSGAPYPQLIQNYFPENKQCSITNPYKYPITLTLTAKIYQSGSLIQTVTKSVVSLGNSSTQHGSYVQEACVVNNLLQKKRSGNINGNYFYLNQGCLAEITLYDMAGLSVSFHGGFTPSFWHYDSTNRKLLVRPALGSSGVPTSFKISGGCNDRIVQFFTYSLNEGTQSNSTEILLHPNPSFGYVNVTIEDISDQEMMKNQAIIKMDEMISSITIQLWNSFGLLKQVQTDQSNYQLDLTGVAPGFYYVHVIKDGQTYRKQLVVQ